MCCHGWHKKRPVGLFVVPTDIQTGAYVVLRPQADETYLPSFKGVGCFSSMTMRKCLICVFVGQSEQSKTKIKTKAFVLQLIWRQRPTKMQNLSRNIFSSWTFWRFFSTLNVFWSLTFRIFDKCSSGFAFVFTAIHWIKTQTVQCLVTLISMLLTDTFTTMSSLHSDKLQHKEVEVCMLPYNSPVRWGGGA